MTQRFDKLVTLLRKLFQLDQPDLAKQKELNAAAEQYNLVLDAWFAKEGYSSKASELDLIHVNGGCNLENLKAPDDTWKVRLIEEDFHRLMFDMDGV